MGVFSYFSRGWIGGQLRTVVVHGLQEGLNHNFRLPLTVIMTSHSQPSAANIVGLHYRVGRKIGEGSFGVIFEGLFRILSIIPQKLQLTLLQLERDKYPQFSDRCN